MYYSIFIEPFMRNQFFAFLFILFSSLITTQVVIADTNINPKNNEFYDIKIRLLNKSESTVSLQCHKKLINDATWQAITFESLPQNQHFCFRASINIDQSTLTNDPILLIGMLASAQIYWDGKLLINKGVVG
jgi:hypothetical protein